LVEFVVLWLLPYPFLSSAAAAAAIPFQAEQREKERRQKEKQEAHLYCQVRIATDADIAQQVGFGHGFTEFFCFYFGGSCFVFSCVAAMCRLMLARPTSDNPVRIGTSHTEHTTPLFTCLPLCFIVLCLGAPIVAAASRV
jgi:class 3 adenylate cyclase